MKYYNILIKPIIDSYYLEDLQLYDVKESDLITFIDTILNNKDLTVEVVSSYEK